MEVGWVLKRARQDSVSLLYTQPYTTQSLPVRCRRAALLHVQFHRLRLVLLECVLVHCKENALSLGAPRDVGTAPSRRPLGRFFKSVRKGKNKGGWM